MRNTILRILDLIKKGEITFMINGISKRVFSETKAFGLKRDLNTPLPNPKAKMDIIIRPYNDSDKGYFSMDLQNTGLIEKDIATCYVAATTENVPCYRQWLMGPEQNNKIKEFWRGTFPVLNRDEGLLESAFTVPAYRGNRIMPEAMARITNKGYDLDIRYVITFVGIENVPSLKGCHRSGFAPYVLRTEKWVFFKRRITFEDVPKTIMDAYLLNVTTK